MVFSSFAFIFIFLPCALLGFYVLKALKFYYFSRIFLVGASFVFYAYWKFEYIFILLFSILVNFLLANAILSRRGGGFTFIGVVFNLAFLGFFKYTDFFLENFNLFSHLANLNFQIPLPHLLLPLAISFFTFQQIAFLVDCHKKAKQEFKEKIDFVDYCLFVSFFPQLIAGPIVHHKEMMPQFHSLLNEKMQLINWEFMAKGLFIFSLGLFKKIFIADSFAKWANAGFKIAENGGTLNIAEAWASSLCYTFELYFDFSGYCDMAIGLGLFFGVVLPINFNSPYKSLNISEFWRRWHITLGRFLKDYLYIPLGGNRLGLFVNLRNLFIVAFLSGIWHGAGWGFVLWGLLHAFAMILHRIYSFLLGGKEFLNSKIYKFFAWFVTFNFINIAWIFFRSQSVEGSLRLVKAMFGIDCEELPVILHRIPDLLYNIGGRNNTLFHIIIAFLLCSFCKNSIELSKNFKANLKTLLFVIILFYVAILQLIAVPYTEFIYFNF